MTSKVSSEHKDAITVLEFIRGFFWEIIAWIVRAETHFQSYMIECRLNHSHLSEPLAVVNMSILTFTVLHLEQCCHHDPGKCPMDAQVVEEWMNVKATLKS